MPVSNGTEPVHLCTVPEESMRGTAEMAEIQGKCYIVTIARVTVLLNHSVTSAVCTLMMKWDRGGTVVDAQRVWLVLLHLSRARSTREISISANWD
jgi:hypothetical protein